MVAISIIVLKFVYLELRACNNFMYEFYFMYEFIYYLIVTIVTFNSLQ